MSMPSGLNLRTYKQTLAFAAPGGAITKTLAPTKTPVALYGGTVYDNVANLTVVSAVYIVSSVEGTAITPGANSAYLYFDGTNLVMKGNIGVDANCVAVWLYLA